MHRSAAVAVVVAVLAAVQLAWGAPLGVLPADCATAIPSTLAPNACYKGTATLEKATYTLTVTQDMLWAANAAAAGSGGGATMFVMIWGQQRILEQWANVTLAKPWSVVTPTADLASPTSNSFNGRVDGYDSQGTSIPNAVITYSNNGVCVGDYSFTVDRSGDSGVVNMDFYFAITLGAAPGSQPVTVPIGATIQVPPSVMQLPGQTTDVFLLDEWTNVTRGGWTVSGIQFAMAPTVTSLIRDDTVNWATPPSLMDTAGNSLPTGPQPSISVSIGSKGLNYTHKYGIVGPTAGLVQGPSLVLVQVTAPYNKNVGKGTYPKTYDWTANGPFVSFSFTYTSTTEWPDITQAPQPGKLYRNQDTASLQLGYAVYRVPSLGPRWLSVTLEFSNVMDVTASAPHPPNADPAVAWGSGSTVGDPTKSSSYSNAINNIEGNNATVLWNPLFRDTSRGRAPTNTYLTPALPAVPESPWFVYVTRSSCNGYTISFDLQASVGNLGGECFGYNDCNSGGKNPGAGRAGFSSNSDHPERFRHCLVVDTPQASAPNGINSTTRCTECVPAASSTACECKKHQFCVADDGICQDDAGNFYVCDPFTHDRYGMCLDKNFNNVLGGYCRANVGLTFGSGPKVTGGVSRNEDSTEIAIYAEGPVNVNGFHHDYTGYGFCGAVRYYNDTGTGVQTSGIAQNRVARTILWSGSCINQQCLECAASQLPTQGAPMADACGRYCLNGKVEDAFFVDGTSRTYGHNSVAGTTLAAVFMLILLQMCVCASAYVTYTGRIAKGKPTPLDTCLGCLCSPLRRRCPQCRPYCDLLCCRACCHDPAARRTGGRAGRFGGRAVSSERHTTSPYVAPSLAGPQGPGRREAPKPPTGGDGGNAPAAAAAPVPARAESAGLAMSTSPTMGTALLA